MYLWWSLCTLYVPICRVRVTIGDSGLCCCTCVTWFEPWFTPLCVHSEEIKYTEADPFNFKNSFPWRPCYATEFSFKQKSYSWVTASVPLLLIIMLASSISKAQLLLNGEGWVFCTSVAVLFFWLLLVLCSAVLRIRSDSVPSCGVQFWASDCYFF